jgi:LPXTG-motif cell wall-anchored protein
VLAPIFTASPALAAAGQSVVTGRTAAQLVQEMVGTGIAGVSNATFTGAANANGIFSGMGGIGIDSGIVLSTGAAAAVMGPNISGQTSTDYGAPGDASLTSLAGGTTYDAAILQFDFVPVSSPISFTFLYGSEEYPEYVNGGYNDAFAIFVNGVNCAVVPGTSTAVSIDTINSSTNPSNYVNGAGSADTAMDGYTKPITCTAAVTPNVSNHLRFTIADGGDGGYDSWALVQSGTLVANSAPSTQAVTASTYSGMPVATTLLGTDVDGDVISYSYTQPAHGTLSGTGAGLIYTPSNAFVGTDTFSYTATAAGMTSNTSTVTITVAPNTPPTASDQTISTEHDLALAITLLGNDAEGASLGYAVASSPAHGTLTGSGASRVYTPDAGYEGTDSFTFTVNDGVSSSSPATVSIAVTANAVPTASAQSVTLEHDLTLPITLTGSDPDGSTLNYAVATAPSHGALSGAGAVWTYTPNPGYEGNDGFTFTVDDGRFTSAPATVSIAVTANAVPTASAQSLTLEHDLTLPITLTGSDPDGSTLSYVIAQQPTHGALTGSGASWTYTPDLGYEGTDSFTFTVNDGRFTSAAATVDITLTANAAPTAADATLSTRREELLQLVLTASDPDGAPLTFTLGTPAHGTLSGIAPNLVYLPDSGYTGPDSFSYTVSDGRFVSGVATVEITVVADEDPVARALVRSTSAGAPLTITLSGDDREGAALTFAIASAPSHGAISGSGDTLVYTPAAGFSGVDVFTYTVSDGRFTSSAATVTIQVAAGAVALPYTGAQGIESTAWAALLTLAAGGILVARRRRAQH